MLMATRTSVMIQVAYHMHSPNPTLAWILQCALLDALCCCCWKDCLALHCTGSAHLPLVSHAPLSYKCIWCCLLSLRMPTMASHLLTLKSHLPHAFADTSCTA